MSIDLGPAAACLVVKKRVAPLDPLAEIASKQKGVTSEKQDMKLVAAQTR
jgi:hypothetical protein